MYKPNVTIERKTITRVIQTKTYTCEKCGQSFIHRENLNLHYKHHQEQSETCNLFNIFKKICA